MQRPRPHRLAGLALFFLAIVAGSAAAQTLYKWIDKDGKVHYADKPPVGFKGEVTRIETDIAPSPAPAAAARPAAKTEKGEADDIEKAPDIGARRRAEREQLAARVATARAKLEKARKALADGEDPGEDEKQFVQQLHPRDERRPDRTPAPRTNCMATKAPNGAPAWNCPVPVPGEAYYERRKSLEDAVSAAEEEVADAERAYRRGVD